VPPASPSLTESTSQGSILLIEEYDALAAAISSALRKFAPGHAVHVARTLNEAKTLARTIEPALLVIDFDPAFPGLSAFLQKLQTSQPDTRALLLAGKLPPEVSKAARSVSALQFIEKPFDVPDFGAAVQALLGPWRESETATSRGTLHDLTVADLLIAQCAGVRTVAIEVTNGHGKTGEIHIRHGTPVHAEAGRKSGNEALAEILDWRDIEARERERTVSTRRTLQAGWPDVLAEAARKAKPRPVRPTRKAAPALPKTGKKLVLVDDTEMLLIFVEDVLMTSGGNFQITTAMNGVNGVKEIARAKPDLVLLDYSLPDMNGDEVCRRLLENDATSRVPVLMMSGHVHEMSKAAASLDNVVATIEKPFLSDALVSLVETVIREGRAVKKKAAGRKPSSPQPPPAPVAEPPPPKVIARKEVTVVPEVKAPPPQVEPVPVVTPAKPQVEPSIRRRAPKQPEPSPRLGSVVGKARRAIEHLRRQVVPEQKAAPEPPAPEPTPPLPVERPPEDFTPGPPPAPPQGPVEVVSTRVLSEGPNEVILTLFLDVVSVQLTPELRMGAIRARPTSGEVSLHVVSEGPWSQLPQTGFMLGTVGLDEKGRIASMRLIPTQTPVRRAPTQNALQIGAVSVVPIDHSTRMQLTTAPERPMTLQLLASLELAGVELSPTFQVSQIVLKDHGHPIRVTLSSQASGQEPNGTDCETLDVVLDRSSRIKEILLNPVR